MTHKCRPSCTAGWAPSRKAHCSHCGENFSTVGNFDKHRQQDKCLFPERVGLKLNDKGVWVKPSEIERDYP